MKPTTIIGIMSGSSLDGLDMAACTLSGQAPSIQWSIDAAHTVPFPADLKTHLHAAPTMSAYALQKLDAEFGSYIGQQVSHWIKANGVHPEIVASHGHTVFHSPKEGFTTQIGSGAHIAQITGIDTITQFRSADVAAGGQGAPFAPVVDRDLFAEYQACINLGGIVNISLVTPNGTRKAWDIGPCNQALNFLARKMGMEYDKDGLIAASGQINPLLVDQLVALFPFNDGQPKGMSNAEVENTWISVLEKNTLPLPDQMASVCQAIAKMISNHLQPLYQQEANILLTGGGAHHAVLQQLILGICLDHKFTFHIPDPILIDYKECLLMAYLGYLHIHQIPFGIQNMTGARNDTIGGTFHKACHG